MNRSPLPKLPRQPTINDITVWLAARRELLATATRSASVVVLLGLVILPWQMTGGKVVMGFGCLLQVFLWGIQLAYSNVWRNLAPARPIQPARVPRVRAYASLAEAQAAGWKFSGACGTYAGQPIPGFAELDGEWFAYQGLELDGAMDVNDRVFGELGFSATATAPGTDVAATTLPTMA